MKKLRRENNGEREKKYTERKEKRGRKQEKEGKLIMVRERKKIYKTSVFETHL